MLFPKRVSFIVSFWTYDEFKEPEFSKLLSLSIKRVEPNMQNTPIKLISKGFRLRRILKSAPISFMGEAAISRALF